MAIYEKNCVVIITGASVDIGRAFANSFASKLNSNSLLILSSRSLEKINHVKEQLKNDFPNVNVATVEWGNKPISPRASDYKGDLQRIAKDKSFDVAIVVHNAVVAGDLSEHVSNFGNNLNKLQFVLNVNLFSILALTTAFVEVFEAVPKKFLVNMTAHSVHVPIPTFGYSSISKAGVEMGLNVLAKENPDVKVLHYDPVLVDTEGTRSLMKDTVNETVRGFFKSFYEENKLLTASDVADNLVKLLAQDSFESGSVVEASDVL
uniref:Uncharacterized protein n=1 Tax=Plectus sambesii TaxID=2011161 RepID=A0A914VPZ6_9BILA